MKLSIFVLVAIVASKGLLAQQAMAQTAMPAAAQAVAPETLPDVHQRIVAVGDIPAERRTLTQRLQLARDLMVTDRFDESLAEVNAATQRYPTSVDALILKGDVLMARNQFDQALAVFDAAAKLDRNSAEAQRGRGQALFNLGKGREADAASSLSTALKRRASNASPRPPQN
jgi:Flp pilus assembly protein TadD